MPVVGGNGLQRMIHQGIVQQRKKVVVQNPRKQPYSTRQEYVWEYIAEYITHLMADAACGKAARNRPSLTSTM